MVGSLKPCPFCGEVVSRDDIYFGECNAFVYLPHGEKASIIKGGATVYFLHCPHCDANFGGMYKGDFGSPEEVVAAWNRRISDECFKALP